MKKFVGFFAASTSKETFEKVYVLHALVFLAFIQGCDSDVPPSIQDQFGDEIRLSRIDISQGGIIGDYNFYQTYPKFMDDAVRAVGTLSLYVTDGTDKPKFIGNGVGIHIHDTDLKQEFILTAAHIIYDVKTGKKKGDAIRFGQIGDGQRVLSKKISRVPNEHKNFIRGDWVFIPITNTNGRTPLDVKLRSNYFIPNKSLDEKYDGYFISISSTNGEKLKEPVRFVQRADNLYFGDHKSSPGGYVFTDLDAIKGLSGSPVFFVSDQQLQLIGVLSRKGRAEDCDEITSNKYCANGVALLPALRRISPDNELK